MLPELALVEPASSSSSDDDADDDDWETSVDDPVVNPSITIPSVTVGNHKSVTSSLLIVNFLPCLLHTYNFFYIGGLYIFFLIIFILLYSV